MKFSLARLFLLILVAGIILLTLIVVGTRGMPEPLPALRVFLGVVLVLLVPGFALQAALFPHGADLDPLVRAAFSFGLSLAVLPPIFLILNALGLGIEFWPVAIALALFVCICAVVAIFRWRRLPEKEKFRVTLSVDAKEWWAAQDRTSRLLYVFLAVATITAAVSAVFISQESAAEPFTEFYLLDTQGLTMDYPREVAAGEPVDFILGITNHEENTSQYRVVVVGGGDQALASAGPISLADGASWQGAITIRLTQPGNGQRVEFLLERTGSAWPYRTLRVWMNVLPAGEPTPGLTPTSFFTGGRGQDGGEGGRRCGLPAWLRRLRLSDRNPQERI